MPQIGIYIPDPDWKQFLSLYNAKPKSPQDYAIRKELRKIFTLSFYNHVEKTKGKRIIRAPGGMIFIPTKNKEVSDGREQDTRKRK